jgi:hypothetical protein
MHHRLLVQQQFLTGAHKFSHFKDQRRIVLSTIFLSNTLIPSALERLISNASSFTNSTAILQFEH